MSFYVGGNYKVCVLYDLQANKYNTLYKILDMAFKSQKRE